jgi:hypothetical protein
VNSQNFAIGASDAICHVPAALRRDLGCHLTTLFSSTAIPTVAPAVTTTSKKKYGILPILIVLFLISYGLMTMLIVEQGSTIESQRALIRELYRDSRELSSVKTRIEPSNNTAVAPQGKMQAPSLQGQAPTTHAPSVHTPPTQAPSTQAPMTQSQTSSTQTPSTQARTQHSAQNKPEKAQKFQLPSKPAPELVDDRRALITI